LSGDTPFRGAGSTGYPARTAPCSCSRSTANPNGCPRAWSICAPEITVIPGLIPRAQLSKLVPPALVATKAEESLSAWKGMDFLGIPISDGPVAHVMPEELGKWLDFVKGRAGVVGALDLRLLVLLASTWTVNATEDPPLKFTEDYIARVLKRYLNDRSTRPDKTMMVSLARPPCQRTAAHCPKVPPMWETSLQAPFPTEKKAQKGGCAFAGCTSKDGGLDFAVKPFQFCHGCTSKWVRLVGELPQSPWTVKFKEQLLTPDLLWALIGSCLTAEALSSRAFDRLAKHARDYLAIVGVEQVHPALVRHVHKFEPHVSEGGALLAANQRHQLSAEQANQLAALGVTSWGMAIPVAERRSFPPMAEYELWWPDTILMHKVKKERILIRNSTLLALMALVWGKLKVVMVTALTALAHFIGCERTHMMELDVADILRRSEFTPVVVVKRGHLITPRMILHLASHGGPTAVLHVAVPVMAFGMRHSGYDDAYVGGFACLMRQMAFGLEGIDVQKRNVRILSDCGVQNPHDPTLNAKVNKTLLRSADFTLQCIAAGLNLNQGHVPNYGDLLNPLSLPNTDVSTQAEFAINAARKFCKRYTPKQQDKLIANAARGLKPGAEA
jgi:hypothetical protein